MRWMKNLAFDEGILLISGIVAVGIGLLDFTPFITITTDPALKMTLVGMGFILTTLVTQSARRSQEITTLQDSLQTTHIEMVPSGPAFQVHASAHILNARAYILDTTLNAERHNYPEKRFADNPASYHYAIDQQVRQGRVTYRRVEVMYSLERLKLAVLRLLMYEGMEYFIRYYDGAPKAMPIINMMSLDDETFYLGGFAVGEGATDNNQIAYIKSPQLRALLAAYWNSLWHTAIPLNTGKTINWEELQRIAARHGMQEAAFNTMVEQYRQEIKAKKPKTKSM